MGEFVVRGGRRIDGRITVHGAKNAALPILAASLLASSPVTLYDIPRLRDVDVMIEVLLALGARVERSGTTVWIDPRDIHTYAVPAELMQKMRASIFVLGPLLARLGRASAIQPGGCAIGDRPIDLHLYALTQLGAQLTEEAGSTELVAERLRGAQVHLTYPSVGATENLMMAAALAEGETRIRNAAMEPEIVDLAQFLERMGAVVRGAGTSDIRIVGQPTLTGTDYQIIPDRIEAATYALAVAATGGRLVLENCIADHLPGLWGRLREVGVDVRDGEGDVVEIVAPDRYPVRPISVHTGPYPGFATDMQAQFMAFLLKVPGVHLISERVFENRLGHARELRRLGAQIIADQRVALIYGGKPLRGAAVTAGDLRAGAALVIAGLMAEGETVISGREVIERGYEQLDQNLSQLGADVVAR
ncbi:UDP-N-acetylglucosamine1-carboxyvinyltransferase [Sulfobacillus acidophilus DSM 10332]|uniref:UDP-N-acetylglucosamine 1-carboxyvinyltransferase n=1 Tax=Sulfobacillus acidophilus (strain ATCC 700253 / DSM 10332 / NAL) TaxID=679936 RepID=G8TX31_SULAD|nr:UDP-N-acetylglucosamine1-carboxyvinyltransferase [Sulfobacillus acidophilus DSM 10332]